jgi:hypothetical protein
MNEGTILSNKAVTLVHARIPIHPGAPSAFFSLDPVARTIFPSPAGIRPPGSSPMEKIAGHKDAIF